MNVRLWHPRELLKYGVVIETVEDKEDLTEEWLEEMNKKHKPERVVIEYNGILRWMESSHFAETVFAIPLPMVMQI